MRRWAYPALAFLTGGAVTVFEFAAPNLLRAYFGQTIYVWANVIGVILAALAVGYALGGRWADRTASERALFYILGFAGLYGICVGAFGPRVSLWLAGPVEYPQDAALPAFWVESLAASLLLFGPPVAALGMATPFLVQRTARHWPVGRSAGLIFAISTVGSIVGVYATTYLLLDTFGVVRTILGAAILLLLLAAGGLLRGRRPWVAGGFLLACGVAFAAHRNPWGDLPPKGSHLVLALESPYQLIRIVDQPPDAEGRRERWLMFDEGMGSYHSTEVDEETGWTDAYYDAYVTVPQWVGGKLPTRICILGNAAGTMSRLLHIHHDPKSFRIDGVEIDPRVTEAARKTMGLTKANNPSLTIYTADGRNFLRSRPKGCYDAIILDAYARQVSIPASLATKEFFELVESRLRPKGMLFVNVGALRPGGTLVKVLANTVAAGFGEPVYRCPLRNQLNVMLVAMRGGPPPPPPGDTPLGVPDSFGLHVPTGFVLTDDKCPVERLTVEDLLAR